LPWTLALMHGPSFAGDGAAALWALADDYDYASDGMKETNCWMQRHVPGT
jgi:hypothetical protein